jgi:glycosyltransferase involved in cell wall biosynthesis
VWRRSSTIPREPARVPRAETRQPERQPAAAVLSAPQILITVSSGEPHGGAEQLLLSFLRGFDRRRIAVAVVGFAPGALATAVAALDVPVTVLAAGRHRDVHRSLQVIAGLAARLRRAPPALVFNWTTEAQLYGASAAFVAGLGVRVAWWQHALWGLHWLDPLCTRLPARAIVASSHFAAADQARHGPVREHIAISPGIDPPRTSTNAARSQLRRALGLEGAEAIIGVVGRLQPLKQTAAVLEAAAILRAQGRDVRTVVVGGAALPEELSYERRLQARAREPDLAGSVRMVGRVEQVGPYLELMDVLLAPCDRESFGLAIVEGMALGRAVVAIDAAGPREIVEHGVSGLLAPDNMPATLADAAARLLGDCALRAHLGEGGRTRYAQRFRSERMISELEDLLVRLAGATGRQAS